MHTCIYITVRSKKDSHYTEDAFSYPSDIPSVMYRSSLRAGSKMIILNAIIKAMMFWLIVSWDSLLMYLCVVIEQIYVFSDDVSTVLMIDMIIWEIPPVLVRVFFSLAFLFAVRGFSKPLST